MKLSLDSIKQFSQWAFSYVGIPKEDAAQAALVITQAERSGVSSHGLQRLPMYLTRIHVGAVNRRPQLRLLAGSGTAWLPEDGTLWNLFDLPAVLC